MIAILNGGNEKIFPPLDITGKSVAFIGDSITAFYGVQESQGYVALLASALSLTATNLGVSGETLTTFSERVGLKTMLGQAYGKDIIFIMADTNDWSFNRPLGSIQNSDYSTIRGAVNYYIDQIKLNSPDSEIIFLLETSRAKNLAGAFEQDAKNLIGLTHSDYNLAIKQTCIFRQVRYFNLENVLGLEKANIAIWTQDYLHPNVTGHIEIKDRLVEEYS